MMLQLLPTFSSNIRNMQLCMYECTIQPIYLSINQFDILPDYLTNHIILLQICGNNYIHMCSTILVHNLLCSCASQHVRNYAQNVFSYTCNFCENQILIEGYFQSFLSISTIKFQTSVYFTVTYQQILLIYLLFFPQLINSLSSLNPRICK